MFWKRILINSIKNNRVLYQIYYHIMTPLLQFMGLIVKADKKEFLFVCYGGRKYGDNVRPIYEKMLEDSRFNDWKFIWAFRDTQEFILPNTTRTKKVKIDSFMFYMYALRAKCWITNVSIQRGLNFKNSGTIYVNTWHGVPLKLIRRKVKQGFNLALAEDLDLVFAEGEYDANISVGAFEVSPDKIKITGYPRNDIMFDKSQKLGERVRKKYNIRNEKIVLYAPTYRDYNVNKVGGFTFDKQLHAGKFKNKFGNSFKLLVRAHGAIEDNSTNDSSYIDVTSYPDVEDLLVAADILITDYSGIIFDFALLEKPIICFFYDIEVYKEKRGFFVDLDGFLPFTKCYTEDEVYEAIAHMNYEEACEQSKNFKKKCGLVEKGASQNAVNEIYKAICDNNSRKEIEK